MPASLDLEALESLLDVLESGRPLHDMVRAAARALDASVALLDRGGTVLAVTPPPGSVDERALLGDGAGVTSLALQAGEPVGELRLRPRGGGEPSPALVRVVRLLVAAELARVRGPERASEEAAVAFVRDVLAPGAGDAEAIAARGRDVGLDVEHGGSVLVARAHPRAPVEEGWRRRFLAVAERGARGSVAGAIAVLGERVESTSAEAIVLLPGADAAAGRRAGDGVLRELQAGLPGFSFALGRSREAGEPLELPRAYNEALIAANVAEGNAERPSLAFEEMGAYRLVLSMMSEDPAELQRFYAETVEPLVAYDEQYENSQLVRTLESYFEADGNIAATAQVLYTHRHTIRYRLERVRDLTGLDVGSTEGREQLSLGLKAMRVLGITAPGGPATEAGASGGRVPRRAQNR